MPVPLRPVKLVVMKRNHVNLARKDIKYGHWWLEIGDPKGPDSESYGWWPERAPNLAETLGGISGELNGTTNFGGTPTQDPYHGFAADEEFHPLVATIDPRTDEEIADCLRGFARSYRGEWRWTFGSGQNCHTFQEAAMNHCGLQKRPRRGWF